MAAQSQPRRQTIWERINELLELPPDLKPRSAEWNAAVQQWQAENLGYPVDDGMFRMELHSPLALLQSIESVFMPVEESRQLKRVARHRPVGRPKLEPIDGERLMSLRGGLRRDAVVNGCKARMTVRKLQIAESGLATQKTREILAKYYGVKPETLQKK